MHFSSFATSMSPLPSTSFVPSLTIYARCSLGGDLAEEDRKFAEYLQSQGWSGDVGVKGDEALLDDSSSVEGGKKAGGDVKEVEVSE